MAVIPLSDPGDIKLYIICVMQEVGYPLAYADINDLSLYEGFVSNMDFIEAFDDLEKNGLIASDDRGLYSVTEDGRFLASTLKSDLSGYIHDRGVRAAMMYIDFWRSNMKKDVSVTELEDGRARADMALSKDQNEPLRISMTFDTPYQAKKVAGAFSEDPTKVYVRLIALLGGE